MENSQNQKFLPPGHLLHHRYSIQSTIGQGGFGITYLAYDQKLDQEVCIKELFVSGNSTRGSNFTVQSQSTGGFSFEEFVQRFVQEARQLAKFQHPNIVRVLDIFQENSTAYMVMEYVKGETLKSKVSREGALGEREAMSLISQLLDAVEEVHQKGMLHRDIKPDNVLITPEGRVVLIDFGSAREFAEGKTTTQTAMLTPGYAPIEQYSTRAQRGPYSDIYALGATMYFLLTGDKPIPAIDRVAEELLPPHKLNSRVTSQLSSAVMLAMELKPEHRFQSVAEMREALIMLKQRHKRLDGKAKQKIEEEFSGKLKPPKTKDKGIREKIFFVVLVLLLSGFGMAALFTPLKDLINGQNQEQEKSQALDAEKRQSQKEEESNSKENKVNRQQKIPEKQQQKGDSKKQTSNSQILQNLRNDMVLVQGGTFTIGCTSEQGSDCDTDEKPIHQVSLSSFYISKYEVTQALWKEVMGTNPSYFKGCDLCPVENVTWNNAQGFIRKLNQISGRNYRLPTEAEWEYAARGGSASRGYKYSGGNNPDEVGWYTGNSSVKTHHVGQKISNELGLYDMSGNVWEWCSDWYDYYSSSAQSNPLGPSSGWAGMASRVARGGSFDLSAWAMRVSRRDPQDPSYEPYFGLGFRLALSQWGNTDD